MALRVAIVTVSDRSARGEREDATGPALADAVRAAGGEVVVTCVVADEAPEIEAEIVRLADDARVPLVLTAGGTGFAPRDVTPEATRRVIEKEAPGLAELARASGGAKTRFAFLSRGIAGVRGRTLVVNLPGSPRGAVESWEALAALLPHALSVLAGAGDEHPVS
ncbi:MAG: MogA/MoaB family molybdenum cofactor biosynthesis protein [bacterium]